VQTQCLSGDEASIRKAAKCLYEGGLVAFPTETVYGLGANGLNGEAAARIFEAKQRPADNPLILHVADRDSVTALVREVTPLAEHLMETFWPGPLTLIMPAADCVPDVVRAGLDTVAIRCPDHPVALKLIREAGCPVAAPSANRSGRPSPTCARDVMADMDGRIDYVIDGSDCRVGVESTVLDITCDPPCILRPGGVTEDMLLSVMDEVSVHPGALAPVTDAAEARSPGMLHKHYAPNARVVVVLGGNRARRIRAAMEEERRQGGTPFVMASRPLLDRLPQEGNAYCWGEYGRPRELAATLFTALRKLDRLGATLILCEGVEAEGLGLAVMNRLMRAADFTVLEE